MKIKILLISVIALIGITVWTWPDSRVRVIFCDVGQGDGAIISQGNFQMLVDVGPDNGKMVECIGRHLPFWDKQIEVVVITHDDGDHIGGLRWVKSYYNVQKIYSANLVKNDVIKTNMIMFEVLNPDVDWGNDNDNSIVGVLTVAGGLKVLFLGDVTAKVEQKMVWRDELGVADIIKISHHGSAEATCEELLRAVDAKVAVVSVGKTNKFGHPTKEVLDRLTEFGMGIVRTDIYGDVSYLVD
jgi:competence protein ComEC